MTRRKIPSPPALQPAAFSDVVAVLEQSSGSIITTFKSIGLLIDSSEITLE